jgi:trehalose synthase
VQRPTVPPSPLAPFRDLLGTARWTRFDAVLASTRELLEGRTLWHVSSTAKGGGVAELLTSAVGYLRGAGIPASWAVVDGTEEFFTVTKRVHHLLHGSKGDGAGLDPGDRRCYESALRSEADGLGGLVRRGDVVVLHDPQTLGLAPLLAARGASVIWNCHVGADEVNGFMREAWDFLLPYLQACGVLVFSLGSYVWDVVDGARVEIIPPCIDAFSAKNRPLSRDQVSAVLAASGVQDGAPPADLTADGPSPRVTRRCSVLEEGPVPADAPVVCQVSRWDPLKDHRGVAAAFAEGVPRSTGAHLVLAGPAPAGVSDDPEGDCVLADLGDFWRTLDPATRRRVHVVSVPMADVEENAWIVNALQRRADVVVQKSLAEGFGLTVAEALFKARPLVASGVGGIRAQVTDGLNGLLVEDPGDLPGFAGAVTGLLADGARAERLGECGRETVTARFLAPSYLERYLEVVADAAGAR